MSSRRDAFLIEPIFGYSKNGDTPYRPTAREIVCEWIDAVNFVKYPSRRLTVVYVAFHFFGLTITVLLCLEYASLANLLFVVITVCFLGIVYNTIWYHRYCSHASFRFRRPWYNQLFLWTNPFVFREECYAIPHRIHHQLAERPGDPYGPHLGWLGSYLAIESSQKFNINISEKSYQTMVRSMRHIGFHVNHYDTFKKTGAIEATNYYLARILFIQLLWGTVSLSLGGIELLLAWHTGVFLMAFIIRDFNWRGHGGNFRHIKRARWEFDTRSRALNQRFYGLTVGEWHDNHHKYPLSANNGFLPGQLDLAFLLIKLMHRLGIVESYVDAKPLFEKECLGLSGNQSVMVGKS